MTDDAGYTPTMPAEQVDRLRRWHEDAYRTAKAEGATEQTFDYLGRTIVVPPQVHPINPMSDLFGTAVLAEVRPADRVLDMGTGSGVNAILAAGTVSRVLAVDINPHALAAARANAGRNGVADRVEVRHSDIFDAVDGEFDLILFDPPFRWFAPRDLLEAASADANYRGLTRFFTEAHRHLAPGGRLLVFFGSSGDLDYLHRLMDGAGLAAEVLATRQLVKDGARVDYYTFRLTPTPRDRGVLHVAVAT